MKYETGKWYGWDGGECPVHPETVVEGVYWDNENDCIHNLSPVTDPAADFDWKMEYRNTLLSFRVIKEHKEPREWWFWGGFKYKTLEGAVTAKYKHFSSLRHASVEDMEIIHVREVLK